MKTKKHNPKKVTEMRLAILNFAIENGFTIHAGGYDYYIDNFLDLSRCPCDPARATCPCPEAVQDVKDKGHCLCKLLWKDYATYKKIQLGEDS